MNFQSQNTILKTAPEFSIVLAYDRSPARERALALVDFLEEHFGTQRNLQLTQCQFQQLEDRRFSAEAIDVAADANLVIVATTDGEQLPAGVQQWMEQWLVRRNQHDAALVATVQQGGPPQETRVHCYLQRAAKKAGIQFFAGAF